MADFDELKNKAEGAAGQAKEASATPPTKRA